PDGLGEIHDDTQRPAARTLSNILSEPQNKREDDQPLSNLFVAMMQFIASHEIARSPTNPAEPIPMSVDPSDPFVTSSGQTIIPQDRATATGGTISPRQQQNDVTVAFDGSTVYGSNQDRENALRSFVDGKLLVGPDGGLPVNAQGRRIAGDVRADENAPLEAIHELFLREHNRLADEIKAGCPSCTDQEIFDAAELLIANIQHKIFYDEMLPLFLGTEDLNSLIPDPTVLAGVENAINEFTTAAGRLGHTQVPDTIMLALPGQAAREVNLADCFFADDCFGGASNAEILFGMTVQPGEAIDGVVVDALRNSQVPGFGANFLIDLLATNINRGRDHGLPDYMELRAALGFDMSIGIDDLLPDYVLDAYTGLDSFGIDLLVGLFTEERDTGDYLGETGKALWALQFRNLFQLVPTFADDALQSSLEGWLEDVSMVSLLARDTGLDESAFAANVFLAPSTVPLPSGLILGASAYALLLRRRFRLGGGAAA
ncbi:MAG: peroxidase family protein, partial [Mangrovicoccus sp.]